MSKRDEIIVDENDGFFGVCPVCGKHDGYLNVGRAHFSVCHQHENYWWFASNHFSSWEEQTEADWDANARLLGSYKRVESLHAGAWPKDPEARARALAEWKRERARQVEEECERGATTIPVEDHATRWTILSVWALADKALADVRIAAWRAAGDAGGGGPAKAQKQILEALEKAERDYEQSGPDGEVVRRVYELLQSVMDRDDGLDADPSF